MIDLNEEQDKIKFLAKQYREKLYRLEGKEKKMKLSETVGVLLAIALMYSWTAIVLLSYHICEDSFFLFEILGMIITLALIVINGWAYCSLADVWKEKSEEEYQNALDSLNDTMDELNILLKKNKYDIEKFYKNI